MRRLACWATLLGMACGGPAEDAVPATPMAEAPSSGSQRERELGAFLASHWDLPIPAQGEPPAEWSEAERSLDPATCGACHPQQFADWRTSIHAEAFSPGFSGQLLEGNLSAPASVRSCQTCHVPLAEQQPWNARGEVEPAYQEALREQGLVCAGCHVRGHRRFGPPRRVDAAPLALPVPHGGFEERAEFQDARFCGECHQFWNDAGVNGKPIQNTYFEWKESRYGAEGRTCQSCHMPDRAHRWRGIHDREMVENGVSVELRVDGDSGDAIEAELRLSNSGVGHAFPTYVTPRVFLRVWQVDAGDHELPGTRREAVIGREIDFSSRPRRERFDTRVAPGATVKLDYEAERAPSSVAVVGSVVVDPDYHYRGVFDSLRKRYRGAEAKRRMEEAYRRTTESIYTLTEVRRSLP